MKQRNREKMMKRHPIVAIASIIFLLLHLAGNFQNGNFHKLLHAHSAKDLHTEANENDPCHRKLFHQDVSGCDHTTHVAEDSNCKLCDLILSRDILCDVGSITIADVNGKSSYTGFSSIAGIARCHALPSRGPPAI
jgi:hypothetical protein